MAESQFTLVIGDKNVSSWSLRPWLLMTEFGIAFREENIVLRRADTKERIRALGGETVPILKEGSLAIWETLAIAEYLAERFPEKPLWPREKEARTFARIVSAEMHAGFSALRSECSMNILARIPYFVPPRAAAADIARIEAIWSEARGRFGKGGAFLFGGFSIADAMYAPVATRFRTYGIKLSAVSQDYCEAILALPGMKTWEDGARKEMGI